MDADLETKQGKAIVDASKEANVDRLIFSTLLNVTECMPPTAHHGRANQYSDQGTHL
jgi:hypothetical protein